MHIWHLPTTRIFIKTFGHFKQDSLKVFSAGSCVVWKKCSWVSLKGPAVEMLVCVWADCNSTLA